MNWNDHSAAALDLLVMISREIVHLHDRQSLLRALEFEPDMDGVCLRLLAVLEAARPAVVGRWADARQARIEAEVSDLIRDQLRPDDDLPF